MPDDKNLFQNVLKSFRARMGDRWTQGWMASELDISRGTYNAWETGKSMPDQLQLKRMAVLLELNTYEEELFYGAAASIVPRLHNLPDRNGLFVGREAYFDQIAAALRSDQHVILSGLGGIGKTQLALAYAHRCYQQKTYRAVFWIDAGNRPALSASFKDIEKAISFPRQRSTAVHTPLSTGSATYNANQWLRDHTGWLLVIDDVDTAITGGYAGSFPTEAPGDILFTAQSPFVRGLHVYSRIQLEQFSTDEGLYFLLRHCGIVSDQRTLADVPQDIRAEALWLVLLLGGHALALEQVGAYIEQTGISFLDYIRLIHEQYQALLSTYRLPGTAPSSHPETVISTIMLSFRKASALDPKAADILYFCACLSPDEVPEEVVENDVGICSDVLFFNAAIGALRRYSLIDRHAEHKTFVLHRIVQAVIASDMTPEQLSGWRKRVVRALRVSCENIPDGDYDRQRLSLQSWHVRDWRYDDDPTYTADLEAFLEWVNNPN